MTKRLIDCMAAYSMNLPFIGIWYMTGLLCCKTLHEFSFPRRILVAP